MYEWKREKEGNGRLESAKIKSVRLEWKKQMGMGFLLNTGINRERSGIRKQQTGENILLRHATECREGTMHHQACRKWWEERLPPSLSPLAAASKARQGGLYLPSCV